jgi:mycofactocin precursor
MFAHGPGRARTDGYTLPMPEPTADAPAADADEAPVEEEVLVEEISIDGMCGVY